MKLLTLTWNFPSSLFLEQLSVHQCFCSSLCFLFLLCAAIIQNFLFIIILYTLSLSLFIILSHLWPQLNSPKLPASREPQPLPYLSEPKRPYSPRPIRGAGAEPSFAATRWFAHLAHQVILSGFILRLILSYVGQEHISPFLLSDISHIFQHLSHILYLTDKGTGVTGAFLQS